MKHNDDLFENLENTEEAKDNRQRIGLFAHRLALYFTEEAKIPPRLRKNPSSKKSRKFDKESRIEKDFKAIVRSWATLIETMLENLAHDQAWRFIELNPEVDSNARKITDCNDFQAFTDYFITRRDTMQCDGNELGGLAQLSTAFQREVEKRVLGNE